jgi:NADH:ubiquinone reductase (H+-translocating)
VAHIVILGGGFGGLSAAKALRNAKVPVTLLDRRNHHVFQPLLYQVATATLSPGDIASPIRWIFRHQKNLHVLLAEAERIDVATRRVLLTDGSHVQYDYLIVAAGASHSYFGHEEWSPYAPGLKSIEDALEVRRRMLLAFERAERERDPVRQQTLLTFAIVGGGPTGVELAGTLAEMARTIRQEFRSIDTARTRIVLIEAGPTILAAFPESLRNAARSSLRGLGVEILEGTAVIHIDADGVVLSQPPSLSAGATAPLRDGGRRAAATVIWAAGVAASPIVATLGAAMDRAGRVIVQPDLSIPGHPEVFVVGDAALLRGEDGKPLPGVAQVAMQEAAHAARNIEILLRGGATRPFHYRNYGNMAIVGRGSAIADFGWIRFSGAIAWFQWLFLHIFKLVGFRNRLSVLLQWAAAYLTFQRSVRLITGRTDT